VRDSRGDAAEFFFEILRQDPHYARSLGSPWGGIPNSLANAFLK